MCDSAPPSRCFEGTGILLYGLLGPFGPLRQTFHVCLRSPSRCFEGMVLLLPHLFTSFLNISFVSFIYEEQAVFLGHSVTIAVGAFDRLH
jgi:hypothetical protein